MVEIATRRSCHSGASTATLPTDRETLVPATPASQTVRSAGWIAALVAVLAALGFVYLPLLRYSYGKWLEPDYSHGFLVPLFAGWLAWALANLGAGGDSLARPVGAGVHRGRGGAVRPRGTVERRQGVAARSVAGAEPLRGDAAAGGEGRFAVAVAVAGVPDVHVPAAVQGRAPPGRTTSASPCA